MFEPENELEESLLKAADEPAYRPAFYQTLVSSDIFVIQHDSIPEQEGEVTLEAGKQLQIQNIELDGKPHIPIFTSLTKLQAVLQEEAGYLAINALEFFKIINGSELVLNPGSEYGKQFTKEEISNIINGSFFKPTSTYKAEKETKILIGQPSNYPNEPVKELKKYYKTKKEVVSAYLVHFHNPETGDPPHTLIGILTTGNWNEVVSSSGIICNDVEIPDPPVDFIQIDSQEAISNYFSDIEPFYKKRKFWLF